MPGLLEEPMSQHDGSNEATATSQQLPKGVVLGKDGKPCRSCTSSAAWMSMMKQSTSKKSSTPNTDSTAAPANKAAATLPGFATAFSSTIQQEPPAPPSDCPPDVEQLGRSTWTLLHSLTSNYPEKPSSQHKSNVSNFLSLFSQLYPCWVCAEDFREWMRSPGNEPKLSNQEEFGRWMCQAHNAVNVKLGKKEFDCNLWRERWQDGWRDGRCG